MNKNTLLGLVFGVWALSASASLAHSLTVRVEAAGRAEGQVVAALFSSEEDFLKRPISTQSVKISGSGLANVVFSGLTPGEYAVVVIHDEDEDGKMTRGILGIPKEAYAFSKNIVSRLRKPAFDEAKVAVAADEEIEVRLPVSR
ncbi:MAG: DUF2141 domain-containing protein [Pseudomonadota bacterium]